MATFENSVFNVLLKSILYITANWGHKLHVREKFQTFNK